MRNNKGITMIALIVTIIILLILAGVTIAFLTGENGILNKASTAAETTKKANAKERLKVELLAIQTEELADGKEANLASLDTNKEQLSKKGIEIAESGTPRDVTLDGYTFKVKNDLTIEGDGTGTGGTGGSGSGETTNVNENLYLSLFSSGSGTENDPYIVENAEQLVSLSVSVSYEKNTYEGKYIKLNNDITLDSTIQWLPIGNTITNFQGTFDGNKKTISGIYINNSVRNQGLFGVIGTSAKVRDLTTRGNIKTLDQSAAGIAGMNLGVIENCGNYVSVSATDCVAGIAGVNNGIIKNCFNKGEIYASNYGAGGIAGYNGNGDFKEGLKGKNAYVYNSYNNASITSAHAWGLGGVVGYNGYKEHLGYIYNSYSINKTLIHGGSSGTVENCYTTEANTKLTELNAGIDEVGGTTSTESPWIEDTENINGGYPILNWQ